MSNIEGIDETQKPIIKIGELSELIKGNSEIWICEEITNPNFELRPIEELKGFNFFVDDYQRGYKWASQQVLDLLDDIDEFSIEDGIYCLQPVVTKETLKVDKKVYELIDGQQRMTTIYIILSIINKTENFFNIEYKTRNESAHFLETITTLPIVDLNNSFLDDVKILEANINLYWESYIKENIRYNNVDNYHFYQVFQTIQLWFKNKNQKDIKDFYYKLLYHTNVIWYQVDKDEISERVFININSGKIALTNAELIKALFLINCKDDSNKELSENKQNEIAQEWDIIEYALQNDEFWYFINENPEKDDKPTRIDFLFDIIKQKSKSEKDPYFSYRKYATDIKIGNKLNWQELKDLFDRFQEWFENRTLFHLIGFIISQGFSSIPSLIQSSKGKGKDAFEEHLVKIIQKKFNSLNKVGKLTYYLENLHYEETKRETLSVLLLFNIETYQISDSNFRFPFNRFKKEHWSIEHIHAQNAKLFTTNKEISEWYTDLMVLFQDKEKDVETDLKQLNKLKTKLNPFKNLNENSEFTKENKSLLEEISDEVARYFNDHKVSNLALLDGNTNSSIGNKNFLIKREKILEIDKTGWTVTSDNKRKAFIPICTKNVFLKYYTKRNENIQMSYWGYRDREDYLSSIDVVLNKFYITE